MNQNGKFIDWVPHVGDAEVDDSISRPEIISAGIITLIFVWNYLEIYLREHGASLSTD